MGMGRREERLKSDGGNGLCNYIIFRIPTGRKSRLIKAVGNSVPHYLFLRGEARAQSLTFPLPSGDVAKERHRRDSVQTRAGDDSDGASPDISLGRVVALRRIRSSTVLRINPHTWHIKNKREGKLRKPLCYGALGVDGPDLKSEMKMELDSLGQTSGGLSRESQICRPLATAQHTKS